MSNEVKSERPVVRSYNAFIVTALFALIASPHSAVAQTSEEYALMSRSVWSAFECSALASATKNAEEERRLFSYGFKQGRAFIGALQAGKVHTKDIDSQTPWFMTMLLKGPSADFMLGRIYSAAEDDALKEVYKFGATSDTEDLRQSIALSEFTKRNCPLVGR